MTGFQLKNGDVFIERNEIQMISGAELLRQTLKTVLNTNNGEWVFDDDEGITFSNILGQKIGSVTSGDTDIIRNEITKGLLQVDSSFSIDDFNCEFSKNDRKLTVNFTARNSNGDMLEVTDLWRD